MTDNHKTSKTPQPQRCSICGRHYNGWGNNAKPVNNGRCCDDCNGMVVIPARLKAISDRLT